MKNIFKVTYSIALLTMLVLSSCLKKDLGNYKPDDVKNLEINSSLKDVYLANVGEVLSFDATSPSADNQNLTYKWYYYPATSGSTVARKEVGSEAKLALNINMATGDYFLVAEVTNTKTGVKGYKKITLNVKRLTSEGWLLLTWKDNKTNLSIVTSANEILKDFLQPSAEYPITAKPEKLICNNDNDVKYQPIVIKTAEPNLYFLDHNTFEIHNDARYAFASGANLNLTNYAWDTYGQFFYMWDSNGLVYKISRGSQVIDFPTGFNQPMLGNYKAAKFVLPVTSGFPVPAVLFDEQAKRFLYHNYSGNELLPFQAKPANAPFDVSNFQDEIRFTDLGAGDLTYVVGKNAAGEHRLYTLTLNNGLNVYPATAVDKLDIPANGSPVAFALSGKLPLLYYIVNNALYVYKMGEKRSTFLYTFPSDETVVALNMLRGSVWLNTTINPAVENRLGIATNNAQGGVFYTFDLSATGVLKTGKFNSRDDGFDPIVDIAYKMKK
ncbi:PKD-like family lipoprotein [Pedobacter frigoris]|uniref:PKD-like family lipoprotein n=1 Tax=Pedobacter frigoris TaxID=2571272 RepID=UPI00292D84DD|nr:PKD-like family lipoprotein [Pedobacter frigoris]